MTYALPLLTQDSNSNDTTNESSNTFSTIANRLLIETIKIHSEAFTMSLDLLLRKMAVLDASLFETILRNFLNNPKMKNRAYDDPIVVIVSQLIDHCDILMKFDK